MIAVIVRNWQMYKRYFPFGLFINRILSCVYSLMGVWLISYFLFQGQVNEVMDSYLGSSNYFTYAATGIIFFSIAVATLMNVGRALITEVRQGTLISLLITPYKVSRYFLGTFFEQLGRSMLEFLALLIVSTLLGANLLNVSFAQWLIGLGFTFFVSFCLSIFLANIMLQLRDTYISQNTLFVLMMLLCGITFPKEVLPMWMQWIGNAIPLTQAVDVFRIVCFLPERMSELPGLLAIGSCSAIVYLTIGLVWYKKTERKVISYIFE